MSTVSSTSDHDIKIPPLRGRAVINMVIIVGVILLFHIKGMRPITLRPLLPIAVWTVLNGLCELFRRDHTFGLSPEGIDDRSLAGMGKVPWEHVSNICIGKLFFTDKLFLQLTEPARFFRDRMLPIQIWWRLYHHFFGKIPLSAQWAKDAFAAQSFILDYQEYAFSKTDLAESKFHEVNTLAMPSLTLDNKFSASNPAGVILNPFAWILARPFWPIVLSMPLVVTAAAWLAKHPMTTEFWSSALALNLFYWLRVLEHFRGGDCNPGVVLSVRPLKIAVATDLTLGYESHPVLKIITYRACLLSADTFQVGEIIPTASLYSMSLRRHSTRHGNFHPLPLRFATYSQTQIDAAMSTFGAEQIEDLHNMLAALPEHKTGLHCF